MVWSSPSVNNYEVKFILSSHQGSNPRPFSSASLIMPLCFHRFLLQPLDFVLSVLEIRFFSTGTETKTEWQNYKSSRENIFLSLLWASEEKCVLGRKSNLRRKLSPEKKLKTPFVEEIPSLSGITHWPVFKNSSCGIGTLVFTLEMYCCNFWYEVSKILRYMNWSCMRF